jgi:uncharacterized protein (TIGR03000 family)
MRKLLLASILALVCLGATANRASAWWFITHPVPAYASFPLIYPPGYYGNMYYFPWYYPWYAHYNYSHGWYANWWMGGGFAYYPGQQFPPVHIHIHGNPEIHVHGQAGTPQAAPGKVSIVLPPDAKLTFNGVQATGTGDTRTYVTPDLAAGRDYEYVLTAEVIRGGQIFSATERVIVRAGNVTQVSLVPAASASR